MGSWATAPTIVLLQAGIQDTTSPPPLTPPSHVPYLAKGQQAPSPVGSLFAAPSFTPASALYRADDSTPPTASGHSHSLLLPVPPKLSFTIPTLASQAKPATTDPTAPESPIPTAGSAPPPPSPSQPGEPFVPDLDVSAYSTDYAQLRSNYATNMTPSSRSCARCKMTWGPSNATLTLSEMDVTTPYFRYSAQLRRSDRLKPSS